MEGVQELLEKALGNRYRIEGEVGRGATATVYLARDLAHDRAVAVKVLNPDLVQAVGGQRFLREIRLAAGLQHPHLLAIHDSGDAAGLFYYVTPYLPDGSLRARLAVERQLSIEEALRITHDVGEALAYIHAEGVVHRDVKPENILFSGSHACLADFGIARAISAISASGTATDTLTSDGLAVGTPAYMSPEQASGERAMDARSDQYSLACVTYETIAGVAPFIGATAQAVIAQRFAHAAPLLTFYRPSVPAGINAAVARALSLSPSDRFPSVASFLAALDAGMATGAAAIAGGVDDRRIRRRWFVLGAAAAAALVAALGFGSAYDRVRASFAPALDTTRYAVLPFAVVGEANAAAGEGVTRAVYESLRRWNGLPLVSEMTVRDLLEQRKSQVLSQSTALDAAAALGAGRLIWGRVERDGPSVVVHADVYDVAARRSLRDDAATVAPGSVALRAAQLVNALLRPPGAPDATSYADGGTRNFAAWLAFGRGQAALSAWDLERAEREFTAAAAADPSFVAAQLWRAQLGAWLHPEEPGKWHDAAVRLEHGVDAFPLREAAIAAAIVGLARGDYPGSCAAYEKVRALNPLDPFAWYGLGYCRDADSVVVADRRSPSGWAFRSSWDAAAKAYLKVIETDPRALALPVVARLLRVLPMQARNRRFGSSLDRGSLRFGASPQLAADTLAFVPWTLPDMARGRERTDPARLAAALDRNREILLGVVREWTRKFPRSPDAFEAFAEVREGRFEVGDVVRGDWSALQAVRMARGLSRTEAERLGTGGREVRLLVKRGEFEAARLLADSLLHEWSKPGSEAADSVLRGLAALTGKAQLTARLNQIADADRVVAGIPVPQALGEAAAELDAYADLGVCDGIESRFDKVRSLVNSYSDERRAPLLAGLTWRAAVAAAPCTRARMTLLGASPENRLFSAQRSFAEGNLRRTRVLLDSLLLGTRGARPGEVSLDHTFQLAWLRTALGDTAKATEMLDRALGALPTQGRWLTMRTREAAALARAMVFRAELAAEAGDLATARTWTRSADLLWREADPIVRKDLDGLMSRLQLTH